jgi:tripartite-type tricarboxylate transporter receptor subunit TctC
MTPRLPLLITKKDIEMSLLKISKSIACAITTLGLLSASLIAQAQTDLIPGQKITMVVGFPPGGGVDIAGRLVAERLTALIGRPVIVENRPGASSGVATKYVAASKPDGHIIFVNSNSMLANQLINPDAGYDVDKDLAPIGKFFTQSNILVAHPDFPANTLAELVALSNKQDVTFSSPGLGSIPHLAAERLLTLLANAKIRHIPYSGAAPALNSAMGAQVQFASVSAPTAVSMIKGGKLKGIVVTSAQRMNALPNVPTAIESGYKGFVVETWGGFFVAAGTPKAIINIYEIAISKVMAEPEIKEKLMGLGFELTNVKSDAFRQEINEELKSWRELLTKVKVTF